MCSRILWLSALNVMKAMMRRIRGKVLRLRPDWKLANQSPPDYPNEQRTTW